MSWERNWVERAKKLPVGGKLRIRCCGADNSRTITHKPDCYMSGCFRCKENAVERKSALAVLRSAEDVQEYKKKIKERKLRLTEELDNNAVSWLLLANITPNLWKKYGIRQCLDSGLVFLPIPVNRKYAGYVLRNVDPYRSKATPKYISDLIDGYAKLGDDSRCVVLVEDYLSAIRIHEDTGLTTVCVMGTSAPMAVRTELIKHDRAILWLDSDEAGRSSDTKWRKELAVFGIKVDSVVTEQDPKLLSKHEIEEVLESINVGT